MSDLDMHGRSGAVETPYDAPAVNAVIFHSGGAPPGPDTSLNPFCWWNPHVGGHLVLPTWGKVDPQNLDPTGAEARPSRFRVWPLPLKDVGDVFAGIRQFRTMTRLGYTISELGPRVDVIFSHGALWTGLAALATSRKLRVPLVVSLPGHPYKGILLGVGAFRSLRSVIARVVASVVLRKATAIHLLYPEQVADIRLRPTTKTAVFHDFTPLRACKRQATETSTRTILFLGYPWYLKGVDLLILAFRQIADRHPDVRLRLVGHCPDRRLFETLASGHPRITMSPGVPREEAHEMMCRCSVFVLPSRTEAMGRVLLEAMAAGKPVVASNVDGIPHYVRHGENGLLFESENVADLAAQLDRVLSDDALAKRLGENGRRIVQERYTELHYARAMVGLIYRAVGREPPPDDAFVAPPAHDTTD